MILPSNERVEVIPKKELKKIWLYGAPFSGKTTFADQAPTPLNLNTDGNVKYVTMPRLEIKDQVKVEGSAGRERTVRTFAWQIFKDVIDELEKQQNNFETIVVDLLEDTYEYCRLFMYDKLDIEHESDDSFRAWDKVRTEFLSTLRKLLNLNYNIILISHEDSSKDITKKTGDKITSIKPNIADKIANKIAGMVDIVARVVVESDDTRILSFKGDEVIFGGGRLKGIKQTQIELTWNALVDTYGQIKVAGDVLTDESTNNAPVEEKPTRKARCKVEETPKADEVEEVAPQEEQIVEPTPTKRVRRGAEVEATPVVEEPVQVEETQQVRRVRRAR